MKYFDGIILGAGPGGLFAAREAARRGLSVALIEAQDRAGRKLSMAGGGMGNITNRNLSPAYFTGEVPEFCKGALRRFGTSDALALLAELRIPGRNGISVRYSALNLRLFLLGACRMPRSPAVQCSFPVLRSVSVYAKEKPFI